MTVNKTNVLGMHTGHSNTKISGELTCMLAQQALTWLLVDGKLLYLQWT